jgi:hypothetical protein
MTPAFGCFQWVDFGFGCYRGGHNVGGQVAVAVFPFDGRLRASGAIPTGSNLGCTVASFAGFNDFTAETAIVTATFGGHEGAFTAFANGLTNHGI